MHRLPAQGADVESARVAVPTGHRNDASIPGGTSVVDGLSSVGAMGLPRRPDDKALSLLLQEA